MIVRPAAEPDLPAIARISTVNDEPSGDPDGPDSRYLEHLLRHARLLVAELDGRVVGFAATIDTPSGWFLTDLYVDPEVHGRGTGRALLAEVFPEDGPRLTFSSSDPRALPIYVRAGMAPWWPLLYLTGPEPGTRPATPSADPRWTVESIGAPEAARVEAALTGHDRSRDWAYWASGPVRTPFVVRDGGRAIAVGYAQPPRLGRLVLAQTADPVDCVLVALGGAPGGPLSRLAIPGPHPATRRLLDLGWLVEGQDTQMASGPDLLDPTRLLPDASLA